MNPNTQLRSGNPGVQAEENVIVPTDCALGASIPFAPMHTTTLRTNRVNMAQQTRRIWCYGIALMGALVLFTLTYNFGMSFLEGRPQSLARSLQVVVQTFTTVGYGGDAPYMTTEMNLLAVMMQISGIGLIFASLPVFIVPLIEDALATAPPTARSDRSDHVILCTYTPRGEALIEALDGQDASYVVIEPDRETATTLHEADVPVVYGDPESVETLKNASIADATAVVADASDEVNASIMLAAQEAAEDVHAISIVSNPDIADYHRYAGADQIVSPRRLLGTRLASKVTTTPSIELDDIIELDESFDILELPIHRESVLVGQTLAKSRIGEQTGAAVLGAWLGGRFVSPVPQEAVIDDQTVLLAVGREAQLDQLRELTRAETRQHGRDRERFVVAGYGVVGRAVVDALSDADIHPTVLDLENKSGVDVACDATNPEALEKAAIEEAQTVIVALGDDTTALSTTLIIRELNPDVEIVARANETESVVKLYRAGADYVLALSTVSGRMVATDLLPDPEAGSVDEETAIVRTKAPKLAGQTLAEAEVRARTGVTVIAVERDGEIMTGIGPSFSLQADDELIVTGTDESIERFDSIAN